MCSSPEKSPLFQKVYELFLQKETKGINELTKIKTKKKKKKIKTISHSRELTDLKTYQYNVHKWMLTVQDKFMGQENRGEQKGLRN